MGVTMDDVLGILKGLLLIAIIIVLWKVAKEKL